MNDIAAIFTALGHLTNMVKTLVHTRDEVQRGSLQVDFNEAVIDLQSRLSGIQASYQSLFEAHEDLKKQLVAHERWEQESARYMLHELVPGILVYALKAQDAAGQPLHWLCATCFQDRQKSILHRESKDSDVLVCARNPQHLLITGEREGIGAVVG